MTERILVTGAAGYIGSHACLELIESGFEVIALDNLSNSSLEAIRRVEKLTGTEIPFHEIDLVDEPSLSAVFHDHDLHAVMHFAGLKAVGESVEIPLRYYQNNLIGTMNLLQCMKDRGVKKLVFSSSCTVYGEPETVPISEQNRLQTVSPYGRTKFFIEEMCRDLAGAPDGGDWKIVLLRYFNPVGAHESGLIGEDPKGIPNNLMPYILQVAVGRREYLRVFGDDYPTRDGTGIRDYLHVVDLAKGHVAAIEKIDAIEGCVALNLGTGRGHSVLEVLHAVERAVGREIPHEIAARRPGDTAEVYADPSLAHKVLGWKAGKTLDEISVDSWRWQSQNPQGYGDSD
jgi:UDP-glucose 4-epimerase